MIKWLIAIVTIHLSSDAGWLCSSSSNEADMQDIDGQDREGQNLQCVVTG
jgi:hypothetical protein